MKYSSDIFKNILNSLDGNLTLRYLRLLSCTHSLAITLSSLSIYLARCVVKLYFVENSHPFIDVVHVRLLLNALSGSRFYFDGIHIIRDDDTDFICSKLYIFFLKFPTERPVTSQMPRNDRSERASICS